MSRRRLFSLWLLLVAVLFGLMSGTEAYVFEGPAWPLHAPVVLNLQLGVPAAPLADGSASWNDVAVAAMGEWNPHLINGVRLQANYDVFSPAQGDGRNSVFFSSTVYGESFGDDTLAVTLLLSRLTTTLEADVVVNSAPAFDSYRGPLRSDGSGAKTYDLRRVLIHEFGHVLGLDHTPQNSQSIMTPVITDYDTVQADDIAGVTALYQGVEPPPVILNSAPVTGVTGQPFQYHIAASGYPTAYAAAGLPAGLNLDPATGYIAGTPIVTGTFSVQISASNKGGTATANLTITLDYPPVITSPTTATAIIGIPFYYQVTATHNPTTFDFGSPANGLFGLSYNKSTGLLSGIPTGPAQLHYSLAAHNAVGTGTSDLLVNLVYDGGPYLLRTFAENEGRPNYSALTLASDGNFYGTAAQGGASGKGSVFRLTPSGDLTILHSFSGPYTVYNTDGQAPSGGVIEGRDGNLYGTTLFGGPTGNGTLFRITRAGELTTLYNFPDQGGSMGAVSTPLMQGSDGNFYGTTRSNVQNYGTIFKFTPNGGYTRLHTFATSTGFYPDGQDPSGLVQANDGNFYGTCPQGGTTGCGTIFRITPNGDFSTVYTFAWANNVCYPLGTPVLAPDSSLYGTTDRSNASTNFYRYTPGGDFTVLHVLDFSNEGAYPGSLILGHDGCYYGIGYNRDPVNGLVQALNKYAPDGTFVSVLHTFTTAEGVPRYAMTQAADGSFYGVTANNDALKIVVGDTRPSRTYVSVVPATPNAYLPPGPAGAFTVRRDGGDPTQPVTVNLSYGGSARAGIDYAALPATVTVPAGATTVDCKVAGINPSLGSTPAILNAHVGDGSGYLANPNARDTQVQVYGISSVGPLAPFFTGEVPLSQSVYYLAFAGGNIFGYYAYFSDPHYLYHFDLGYEYWFDAADGHDGVYLYDFAGQSFFYTSPTFPFPYLYDFSLNAFLYYFPDPYNPGRYNTNGVRYFYNFATGRIIVK